MANYIEILKANNQEHLLNYLKMANENGKKELIKEIENINFDELKELYKIVIELNYLLYISENSNILSEIETIYILKKN